MGSGRRAATARGRGTTVARIWLALGTAYLVWGSTYLAIRVAVAPRHGAGLPPLLMAGARFGIAGVTLLAITAAQARRQPVDDPVGPRQWVAAALIGLALLLGGNGLVTVAERHLASGLAALVVATTPLWAATLSAVRGGERFTLRSVAGLALGSAGVAVLVVGGGHADLTGVGLVLAAALSWAAGSYYAGRAPLPRRALVGTALQMVCGGLALLLLGVVTGELPRLHPSRVPVQAWAAFGYLVVAGALVAYTAYAWLLRHARLSLVTTYAYVNPLVAVLLGALLLGERLGWRTLAATVGVVAGVCLIVSRGQRPVDVAGNADDVDDAGEAGTEAGDGPRPPAVPAACSGTAPR